MFFTYIFHFKLSELSFIIDNYVNEENLSKDSFDKSIILDFVVDYWFRFMTNKDKDFEKQYCTGRTSTNGHLNVHNGR